MGRSLAKYFENFNGTRADRNKSEGLFEILFIGQNGFRAISLIEHIHSIFVWVLCMKVLYRRKGELYFSTRFFADHLVFCHIDFCNFPMKYSWAVRGRFGLLICKPVLIILQNNHGLCDKTLTLRVSSFHLGQQELISVVLLIFVND